MYRERNPSPLMRSFYMLELWVSPGGARKADYYLFNTREEIELILADDLSQQRFGPYFVLWDGGIINLFVYSEGKIVWKKDLQRISPSTFLVTLPCKVLPMGVSST